MVKRVRKAVKRGAKAMASASERIGKELKALMKASIMDKGEAKKVLKAFVGELRAETKKVASFAKQELKKEMKKAKKKAKPMVKGAMKGAVARWRKARKR